jgi:hypothetical protein
MKMKFKARLAWVCSILVSLVIAMGAVLKLAGFPPLVEIYSKIGMRAYINVLGIAELIFMTLFLLPHTMRIGFFLLTGYFGGAMAVELSHGGFFILPATILTFIWLAAYLHDGSLFQKTATEQKTFTSLQTTE